MRPASTLMGITLFSVSSAAVKVRLLGVQIFSFTCKTAGKKHPRQQWVAVIAVAQCHGG